MEVKENSIWENKDGDRYIVGKIIMIGGEYHREVFEVNSAKMIIMRPKNIAGHLFFVSDND